jgi:hypothetical protein
MQFGVLGLYISGNELNSEFLKVAFAVRRAKAAAPTKRLNHLLFANLTDGGKVSKEP